MDGSNYGNNDWLGYDPFSGYYTMPADHTQPLPASPAYHQAANTRNAHANMNRNAYQHEFGPQNFPSPMNHAAPYPSMAPAQPGYHQHAPFRGSAQDQAAPHPAPNLLLPGTIAIPSESETEDQPSPVTSPVKPPTSQRKRGSGAKPAASSNKENAKPGKNTAAKESAKPAAAAKATNARKKGVGAKSGVLMRRDEGESDNEIAKLSDAKRDEAKLKEVKSEGKVKAEVTSITAEDKIKLVEYITSDDRFKDFKLKQALIFSELANKIFGGKYTVTQIKNYWNNNAWDKYKCVCELIVRHTKSDVTCVG